MVEPRKVRRLGAVTQSQRHAENLHPAAEIAQRFGKFFLARDSFRQIELATDFIRSVE